MSQLALVFRINRTGVYDILRKEREGNLKDRSRRTCNQPRRTPDLVEDKVIEVRYGTRYEPARLSRYLKQHAASSIPSGTIRYVVRRDWDKIKYLPQHQVIKERREFIDLYSARPFEIVQMDLKYITVP